MRTTLDLDDRLLKAARELARKRGTTLTAVVEEALSARLALQAAPPRPYQLTWKPHSGQYVGGVDVADRDALYDVMEGRRR